MRNKDLRIKTSSNSILKEARIIKIKRLVKCRNDHDMSKMNEIIKTTDFSAKEPALGYYYQIRYSLYLLLKAKEKDHDTELSIEELDDIVIEDISSINLLQTKLHIKSVANLTNSSPDLWKTIRVWSSAILYGKVNPEKTIFTLVTTAKASDRSIAYELCKSSEERNNAEILKTLEGIIDNSESKSNNPAYNAFRMLSKPQRESLVKNMRILDSSLNIEEVKLKTLNELKILTTDKYLMPFYENLEGWWFNKCIEQLSINTENIKFSDLRCKILDIIDQFNKKSLPIDFFEISIHEADYDNRRFVKQLKLISIGRETLKNAISDYYRAFEQRSKWVREDLLNPHEEEHYESRLHDDWKAKFDLMKEDLNSELEEELTKEGRKFYTSYYIKSMPQVYIREKVTDGFLIRGSCHMLSDDAFSKNKIGWHPNFENQLKEK